MLKLKLTCLLLLLTFSVLSQGSLEKITSGSHWVDSVFKTMTPAQKIGQLFMAAAYSNQSNSHETEMLKLIEDHHIGGLVFFQGGPVRQAKQTNRYQKAAKIPLLIAMDAEWGVGMRLDSTISFPYQLALGAIDETQRSEDLIYQMGQVVAQNFKRLGMHMNFAPVADVNNNADNPVINYRSFGENPYKVAAKSISYMKGMQDNGILATAKHFPGHGDTGVDSHFDFPVISHNEARMDSIELYPFKKLIENDIAGVMIAHLSIPAYEKEEKIPATLSKSIITGLLREKMNFNGLVVTDAMNMAGLTKHHEIGEADVKAIQAGNDLIEFTTDIPKAIKAVAAALKSGAIKQAEIDDKCKKILMAKYRVGLDQWEPVKVDNIVEDLNLPSMNLVNRKLVEASLTVLNNKGNILPVKNIANQKIASLSIGESKISDFQRMLENYTSVKHYNLSVKAPQSEIDRIKKELVNYDLVIVGLHQVRKRPSNNRGYPSAIVNLVNELSAKESSIMAVFRNPYTLQKFSDINKAPGLIMAYFQNELTEELTAQLIFGGVGASGKLPVSVLPNFRFGEGQEIAGIGRFKYTIPEEVGMNSILLAHGIDSLVYKAMNANAIPGAQVLVAKDGKVVFHKAYGRHTYFDNQQVDLNDVYDLASITKVTTALPLMMQLVDENKLNLDNTLGSYMPEFKNSNKGDLPIREILAHQAQLKSWIPYWKTTIKKKNNGYKARTFKTDSSDKYPIHVTDQLFLHKNYKKKIFKAIKKSPLESEKKYLYSGLAFYVFPTMVAEMTQEDFQEYLYRRIYNPIGANHLRYQPYRYFNSKEIVPTEFDLPFRHVLIHGRVHDEGAALMDGVSGNAGLFGNANDLAKLFQLYLNMGQFGGEQLIQESTVKEFTSYQYPENNNRRGLGFDKPGLTFVPNGNVAKDASPESFGHTGFTGTRAWADPKYGLVYIFLSNRVHPTRENVLLYRLNTRTDIEQVIYDSFLSD